MPIVPKVYIHRACGLGDEHKEVDTKTDWDDKSTDCRIVSHGSCCRPTHIKDIELQMIQVGDTFQRVIEVCGEQSCHNTKTNESYSYKESRLESLSEFHAYTKSDNGEDDRHHHTCTQTDNVTEYLFHFVFFLIIFVSRVT